MAESKQKPRRQAAQPARGLVHPDPQLSQAMQLLQAAGDLVIARLGSRSQRRRRWANEHPAEFYHELLRGLLRLAYCAAAARIEPGACAFESCGSGLRLGSAFQPHEHGEPAQAILDLAGQHSSNPGEGLAAVYQSLLALRPGISAGRFGLTSTGPNRRWLGGSWFTPRPIVEGLLDLTLEPLLEARDLLELRICDPSCGGGAFLVAAARRIAERLGGGAHAMMQVQACCIHGVDVDSAAVELCRFTLWLESPAQVPPWRHLEASIRIGDSLVGATPVMASAIPNARTRLSPRERCDRAWLAALRSRSPAPEASVQRALPPPFHWHLEFPEVFSPTRCAATDERTGWPGGFDIILGNPPFLNRLEDATAAGPAMASFLKARFGSASRCYADAATAFLVLASQLVRDGGAASLIQPQSLLAARDAGPARRELAEISSLCAIWFPTERTFDANVRVCAPVLIKGGPRHGTCRVLGNGFYEHPARDLDMDDLARQPTWSPLVADLLGIPRIRLNPGATCPAVGDLATVTADFRDQYYGLRGCVRERKDDAEGHPRLITTGMVDLAHSAWGERPVRFDGQYWRTPRVEVARLEPEIARWAASRLRPKLLIATQTRIIEIVADEHGTWLPVTPLISVLPNDPQNLWLLAAAISSPPIAALALERHAGAALSVAAIKLSARQVAALPLPATSSRQWHEAADLFQRASAASDHHERSMHLGQSAALMCEAYGIADPSVLEWWERRASTARAPRSAAPPETAATVRDH